VLDIPTGEYRAEWVNPCIGTIDKAQEVAHKGGGHTIIAALFGGYSPTTRFEKIGSTTDSNKR